MNQVDLTEGLTVIDCALGEQLYIYKDGISNRTHSEVKTEKRSCQLIITETGF